MKNNLMDTNDKIKRKNNEKINDDVNHNNGANI